MTQPQATPELPSAQPSPRPDATRNIPVRTAIKAGSEAPQLEAVSLCPTPQPTEDSRI